jgi:hypothetical protein
VVCALLYPINRGTAHEATLILLLILLLEGSILQLIFYYCRPTSQSIWQWPPHAPPPSDLGGPLLVVQPLATVAMKLPFVPFEKTLVQPPVLRLSLFSLALVPSGIMAKMHGERPPTKYKHCIFKHGRDFEEDILAHLSSLVHHPCSSLLDPFFCSLFSIDLPFGFWRSQWAWPCILSLVVHQACFTLLASRHVCYRHNLAEPEGGLQTRWAQKMNTISLRIGSCTGVWRAKSAMYLV